MSNLAFITSPGLHMAQNPTVSTDGYEDTHCDFGDMECFTISQIDEAGKMHNVIISREACIKLRPYITQWLTSNDQS